MSLTRLLWQPRPVYAIGMARRTHAQSIALRAWVPASLSRSERPALGSGKAGVYEPLQ